MTPISEALAIALDHHRAGRLAVAEQIYRQILRVDENQAEAYNNLGVVLMDRGRLDEAALCCRRAAELRPDFAEAHQNLALALKGLGALDDAVVAVRRALVLKPTLALAHNLLGMAQRERGKLDEAAASLRRALELKPAFAEIHGNLGLVLTEQGKLEEAILSYRRAVELRPGFAEIHCNLSRVFNRQGKWAEAVESCRRALALQPGWSDLHNILGVALKDQGKLDDAIASFKKALELAPEYAEAHNNLANAYRDQGRLDEAIASFRRAIEMKPELAGAHNNLASAFKDAGRLEEAAASFRRAMSLDPCSDAFHSNLILTLLYHPACDAASIREELRCWTARFAAAFQPLAQSYPNERDPSRRLRIGYVSSDFHDHAVGRNVLPIIERHDHARFEVICYSNLARTDGLARRFQAAADGWREIGGVSDEAVAEMIRADRIDILIDLALHTSCHRLKVFARKPAPVQVSWAGYPGSTGLGAIDYRLTDPHLDPPGAVDETGSEEPIRLPHSFWCYDPLTKAPPVNPLPAAASGFITFGSLNNFCKVNEGVIHLWSRVLAAVQGSRLLLLGKEGEHRPRVLALFQRAGVEPDRIDWLKPCARPLYFAAYHGIDIGLDTFPYNGHTTSLDSFWMGVPVITLVGKTIVGRGGLSQAMNLGLPELVATSPDQFVEIASDLAQDLPRLSGLRASLRERMQGSPLTDAPRFTQNVENAYREMWRRWCVQALVPDDREAVRLMPDDAQACCDQGLAFAGEGKLEDSVACFRRAVELNPGFPAAHNNLGVLLKGQGQLDEAIACYRRALELKPDFAEAHENLGLGLREQGKVEEAEACARRALALKPCLLTAHNLLGLLLKDQGKLDEAAACYRRALELKPGFAEVHGNLGLVLREQGKLDEAIACCRRALELRPDHAGAYTILGVALKEQGKPEEATAAFRRALALEPKNSETHNILGVAWMDQGRLDEAMASLRLAIELKPDSAGAHNNLGNACKDAGRLDEALACFRRAVALAPRDPGLYCNLLHALHYHPAFDAAAIYAEHREWNRKFAEPLRPFIRPHSNERDPDRRLRLGYVSPDFRDHAVGRNVLPIIERHDRARFEVFCYSNLFRSDAMAQRFQKAAHGWRDLKCLSDQAAADLIRDDGIDILVDLALHTAGQRLPVFARKPAPIQVAWAGYPGTTGLDTIDYRLTDPYLDPSGATEENSSEMPIRLPDSFWCYDPLTESPPVNPLPALSAGCVTFGSLNNYCKVNDGVIALWSQILHEVEGSRLLLLSKEGGHRERALEEFRRCGIERDRIEWLTRTSRALYLAAHHRIDLGLDPFPYNGHTTSLDALWMGVPVVTLIGRTIVGRGGLSQAMNLRLPELIASTPAQYIEIASGLAHDLPRLNGLRCSLRERMLASPLTDAQSFTRNVEAAYRGLWRTWCANPRS